jgi:hypothetical protein
VEVLTMLTAALNLFRRSMPDPAPTIATGPRPGDLVVYGWDDANRDGIRQGREIGHVGILSHVPGVTMPDPPSVVEARKWIGKGIYKLGTGGRRPEDGTPFDKDGHCDCSGFTAHVLGIDRVEDGQWWSTDSIRRDGKTVGGRWDPVPGGVDLAKCKVIHCASSRVPGGGAVRESSGKPWAKRGIVVRLNV